MFKRSKKEESEESKQTRDVKDKPKTKSKNEESVVLSQNPLSQPDDEHSSLKLTGNEQKSIVYKIYDSSSTNKQDSYAESHNVEDDLSNIGNTTDKISDSSQNVENAYYIDDIVNKAGCGKFQLLITILCGLGLISDAFEAIILSNIGGFMACDWNIQQWQNALLTSVVFLGMTFGSPSFGTIADIYGRRIAIGLSLFSVFVLAAGSALSPNFVIMMIVRCILGFALGGVVQGSTLVSEYYPAVYRGIGVFYLSYFWAIGIIFIILCTWVIMENLHSWRWLLFVASLPSLIVFLAIGLFPESARYYLVSQQPEKAAKQLEQLAHMNKIEMPKGRLKLPKAVQDEHRGRIWDLLKPSHRVTTLLIWYIWFAVAFTYYGYALITPIIIMNGKLRVPREQIMKVFGLNATSNFLYSEMPCKKFTQGSYIDLLWTSTAELPGLVLYTFLLKILNRKTILSGSCLLVTLITFLLLIDTRHHIVSKVLVFLGRANVFPIYQLSFILTLEAFPTTLRAVALGTGTGIATLGGAVVPFAAQLSVISHPIATVCLIGLIIFFAALSGALLPLETKDVNLKEFSSEYIAMDSEHKVKKSFNI